MRTFDLAPLYRSTVGFDRLFSLLDQGVESAAGAGINKVRGSDLDRCRPRKDVFNRVLGCFNSSQAYDRDSDGRFGLHHQP